MLGTCGEYIVNSSNTVDNIVDKIKSYELSLGVKTPSPLVIKKIGIKVDKECVLKINKRNFNLEANGVLEFGYNVFDITSIIAQTQGVKIIVRYLY